MIDPAEEADDNGNVGVIAGATELAEWATARATAKQEPVKLAPDLVAFVVPRGYNVERVDISGHIDGRAESPRLTHGQVTVNTVDSFVAYTNRHKDERTTLWVQNDGHVVAVLDDHEGNGGGPGWGKHRATLRLVKTPSWQRWETANNRYLSQEDFAELIEQSLPHIVSPDAADLLELAQSLHITRTAAFSSDKRLASGVVKFHYVEDESASAGAAGDMEIPQKIVLHLAPYLGVDPIEVVARFRYRLEKGKLVLGFVIDRLEELLLEVREGLADTITAGTGIAPFAGTPRS